ncbi:thiamine pyrophosphate-dependent enzyme, partial [Anaerofustis sp.]|uniref:thiamine pyrophosphate-dependent enzyme n=1 Tax=Anaerofustis sp. TaxID=1872517 RepID=UPI0025BDADE6
CKPYLLEFKTYRYLGHSKSDQRKYRTKEEEEDMKQNHDAINKFKDYLIAQGMLTEEEFEKLDKQTEKEIENAAEEAKKVNKIISVEEAMNYVYAE